MTHHRHRGAFLNKDQNQQMNVREEVYEQIIDTGFHFTVIHKYRNILFQKLFSHLELY
jgi:hypothetical protein